MAEAGDVAEEVTGAEEAWVAAAGAAEAGVAEALSVEAGVVEAGVTGLWRWGGGSGLWYGGGWGHRRLSVEAGAGVVGGLSMAMVTGVVARTVISGPTAGVVFPTARLRIRRASRDLWFRWLGRWLGWRLVNTQLHPLLPEGARFFA